MLALNADLQAAGLGVGQVGAGAHLKIFLLARGPGLHVYALDFQICQIAGAALQRAHRNIQAAEQVHRVLPQLVEPHFALLRLADHDHLLLLKLMDTVHATLLNAVRALLLAEAGRVRSQGLGQLALRGDGINKFADHRVLGSTDQVQVLTLNLVHHGVHLGKAHYAGNHIGADHKRRHTIGKATVNHKVTGITDDRRVQPGNIAHQVIEAVTGHLAGSVQINTVKTLHNVRMVRHLKVRHHRLPKALHLYIFTVILTDGHTRVNDIGNGHHDLGDLLVQLIGLFGQFFQLLGLIRHLLAQSHALFLLALRHQSADLLRQLVAVCTQLVCLGHGSPTTLVQFDYLIHQGQLFVLKFLFDVLLYQFGIFPHKFHIQHTFILLTY